MHKDFNIIIKNQKIRQPNFLSGRKRQFDGRDFSDVKRQVGISRPAFQALRKGFYWSKLLHFPLMPKVECKDLILILVFVHQREKHSAFMDGYFNLSWKETEYSTKKVANYRQRQWSTSVLFVLYMWAKNSFYTFKVLNWESTAQRTREGRIDPIWSIKPKAFPIYLYRKSACWILFLS